MSVNRRILDDISRLATSAAGLVQGAGREAETLFSHRLERLLDKMDLVPRDEFDAVKAMAAKARMENEALGKRLGVLEGVIQTGNATGKPPTAAAARRKSTTKAAAKPAIKT
jgi:BMFP domain-containing protein YqiC